MSGVFRLAGAVQEYAWGKVGASSKVAQYAQATPGFALDNDKPYAELWMGTHPSAPSTVLSANVCKTTGEPGTDMLFNTPTTEHAH